MESTLERIQGKIERDHITVIEALFLYPAHRQTSHFYHDAGFENTPKSTPITKDLITLIHKKKNESIHRKDAKECVLWKAH